MRKTIVAILAAAAIALGVGASSAQADADSPEFVACVANIPSLNPYNHDPDTGEVIAWPDGHKPPFNWYGLAMRECYRLYG